MQEPVTNAEIEDVLTSIRRLVSEDIRPLRTPQMATAKREGTRPEKLVLTPDLRVGNRDMPEQNSPIARLVPKSGPVSDVSGKRNAPSSSSGFQAKATDADKPLPVYRLVETVKATEDELVFAPSNDEQTSGNHSASDEVPHSLGQLEQTIVELEALIGEQNIEWEPDGSEDPKQEAASEVPLPNRYTRPITKLSEREAAEIPVNPAELPVAEPQADPGKNSAGGAVVFSSSHVGNQQETATATAATDAAPSGAQSQSFEKPVLLLQAENKNSGLSKDELHDMVSRIVREELRGALGQRITRNVRKLVRSEIHRVLDSKSYD